MNWDRYLQKPLHADGVSTKGTINDVAMVTTNNH